jgi:hypothetical protein
MLLSDAFQEIGTWITNCLVLDILNSYKCNRNWIRFRYIGCYFKKTVAHSLHFLPSSPGSLSFYPAGSAAPPTLPYLKQLTL